MKDRIRAMPGVASAPRHDAADLPLWEATIRAALKIGLAPGQLRHRQRGSTGCRLFHAAYRLLRRIMALATIKDFAWRGRFALPARCREKPVGDFGDEALKFLYHHYFGGRRHQLISD